MRAFSKSLDDVQRMNAMTAKSIWWYHLRFGNSAFGRSETMDWDVFSLFDTEYCQVVNSTNRQLLGLMLTKSHTWPLIIRKINYATVEMSGINMMKNKLLLNTHYRPRLLVQSRNPWCLRLARMAGFRVKTVTIKWNELQYNHQWLAIYGNQKAK